MKYTFDLSDKMMKQKTRSIAAGKLSVSIGLMLFLLKPFHVFAALPADTTIVTYWTNGNKKTETLYRKKMIRDKSTDSLSTLLEAKRILYYNLEGVSVSRDEFLWEARFFDTLQQKMAESQPEQPENKPSVRLMLGASTKGFQFPANIAYDPEKEVYVEQDTIINMQLYSICIYKKDTSYTSAKATFSGALRADQYKIYAYDKAKGSEELIIDYMAVVKKAGEEVLTGTVETVAGVYSVAAKSVNNASAAVLGHTLANIILILK